jgi:hypothetical protein
VGGLVALTLVLGMALFNLRVDEGFIAYRYARNVVAGGGFVYNPGDTSLHTDAPLYVLLLALVSPLTSDYPLLGNALGVASIGAGAVCMYALARRLGYGAGLVGGLGYLLNPMLWLALGSGVNLGLALGMAAMVLHVRGRGLIAAGVLGAATLAWPSVAGLAGVLAGVEIIAGRRAPLLPGLVYVAALVPWLVWATSAFGSPIPRPLLGMLPSEAGSPSGMAFLDRLAAAGLALFKQSWAWVGVAGLAAIGTGVEVWRHRWALVLALWGALHVAIGAVLGLRPAGVDYIPLTLGLAACLAALTGWLAGRLPARAGPWLAAGLTGSALVGAMGPSLWLISEATVREAAFAEGLGPEMLPVVDWGVTHQAGLWLSQNTPSEAVVGAVRVGQIGYYAERTLLDAAGWWWGDEVPDYLVLSGSEVRAVRDESAVGGGNWFDERYVEVMRFEDMRYADSPLIIYKSGRDWPPLTEVAVQPQAYPGGLRLVGAATDLSLEELTPGQAAHVRLEWVLDEPTGSRAVGVRLRSRENVVAGQSAEVFDLGLWPVGQAVATHHAFNVAPALASGVYDLEAGIGSDPTSLDWRPVAQARVPLQEGTYLGGLTGVNATFGGTIGLTGYRLNRAEATLGVLLMWRAVDQPAADYVVFVQVRDANGQVVAQASGQPREGTYPTGVWWPGEEVPDEHRVDIGALPPGEYDVYVGLSLPDGRPLTTEEGSETVFLGRVRVGQ